ncbi:MAG: SAM-dependent methyltransferase [Bacteroidota bacterium]
MAKEKVDQTALGVAVIRMLEASYPKEQRLFEDKVSQYLLPGTYRTFTKLLSARWLRQALIRRRDKQFPGVLGLIPVRTRYLDDRVKDALDRGIRQIVILGAGMDSRPYRIAGIAGAQVFEVDRKVVQQFKIARVKNWQGSQPLHVNFVEVDFTTQTLEATLGTSGLNLEEPTLVLWEGVTQYITEEAVRNTLAYLSTIEQAEVIMSYVPAEYLNSSSPLPYLPKLLQGLKKAGLGWYFGLDPQQLPQFVGEYGYTVQEDVGHAEHQERYLRPIGRTMLVAPIERIVWLKRG